MYLDAALEPCSSYGVDEGITCANSTELAKLMAKEIEIGLSWRGMLSWEEDPVWRDIVFLNLEPSFWVGVELFFTPVEATKSDWRLSNTERSWSQFSRFYSRRKPFVEGDEYIKLYIREEFYSYVENLTYFTILDLMEVSGSRWRGRGF